jgi:NADPH:quinone reductase-like Zn-dependent oxidoreductase
VKSAALPLVALTAREGEGFDVVFDTVGGKTLSDSIEAVGLYGQVVSILPVGN